MQGLKTAAKPLAALVCVGHLNWYVAHKMWDIKFPGNGPLEVCRNNKWKLRHTTEAKFFALAKGQPYLLYLNDCGPGQLRCASHAAYAVIKCS